MKRFILLAVLCHWTLNAEASELLPPDDQIKAALFASPQISSALSRRDSVLARAGAIEAGPAEFSVKANRQRRAMRDTSSARYQEHYLALERPIRYWGKLSADSDLATSTKEFGAVEYSDAMHETSRELLSNWFSFLKSRQSRVATERNKELGHQLSAIVQARFKVGEISRLDSELVSAEQSRLNAAYHLAVSNENSFAAIMNNFYPAIRLTESADLSVLNIPPYSDAKDTAKQLYLRQSHELNLARIEAQRQANTAKRVGLERIPDPTVGLYRSREVGDTEVVNGISISIPIPGSGRSYTAQAAYAEAESSRYKFMLMQQKVETDFEKLWQDMASRRAAAISLNEAAKVQNEAATKAQKAYIHGEGTIADLIYSRKVANETQLSSELMTLDAYHAHYRLRLDMHQIWDFD